MRISRRTRIAGVALIAVAGLTLTACGSDSGSKADDNVITVYGTNPQNPLIPTATNEVGGGDPLNNIFAGLVAYNTDGSIVNEVADSIEPNEDSTVWTVTLKDGWTFSDGSAITANSFVDAWNYGADISNGHLGAYFFNPIKGTDEAGNTKEGEKISGLVVKDDKTFEISLKAPESDFPLRLGYSSYFPLPEVAYGSDGKITEEFGNAPIGNGPYQLTKSGWEKNKQISLEPNAKYSGVHEPKNDGLVFKFYAGGGTDAAYTDVQAGNLDVLDQVPPSAVTTFESDSNIQAYNEPGSMFASVTIPARLDHFAGEEGNLRRKAISMSINREQIAEKIYNNTRTAAVDFTSPVLEGWTEEIPGNEVVEHNPTEAKKLWAEADKISKWTGTFALGYNSDGAGHKEWTEAASNQIAENLGIKAEAKAYATFDEMRGQVTDRTIKTAFRTGWQADYPSMLNYLGALYGTGAGSNDGDYSNKKFDELIAKAASTTGDDRFKLITEAQSILMEDLPALPLFYYNSTAAVATDVKGFDFNWQAKPEYYQLTKK
ncbi:peptide ABC transporter substrate-binding protein [Nocardioides yefusunii]|uniref:ABC transporter substrate-binding protein n=1 Tax=Nocardioides yefusunii TaxID=2500546 RepID=A0ABW1QZU8_9ACTN|nr:ABC transporter substrate-binding protein [Nocardioides yefusunii]